jgi:RNA polymerase primary sigma factor
MAQLHTDGPRNGSTTAHADVIENLINRGRQRGYVTQEELNDAVTDPEHTAEIIDALSDAGIAIGDPAEGTIVDDDEGGNNATSLDEGLSDALLGDSVRLYLREIGQVPLLSPEKEKRLAREIVAGEHAKAVLAHLPAEQQRELVDLDTLVAEAGPAAEPADALIRVLWTAPEALETPARGHCLHLQRVIELGEKARREMAAANLRLVVSIAKRYRDRGLPLLDLIQEGSLGLLRAIEKFDVDKGYKFSTYATWWIKQALSRALADQSRLVRLPVHLGETLNRIQAARRQLTQSLGREPNDAELADMLSMTEEKLRELRRTAQDPVSLATPVGEEADSTLADFIPDPHALDADDAAASGMLRDQIATALDQLTERERKVLELRYGLSDGQPRTLEEVGKAFGVTRERVRQIEVKALRKLRHPRLGKLLKDYLDQI